MNVMMENGMTDFTTLTDKQLTEEMDRLWRQHMYYMAAEGNWNQEAAARGANEKEYWACVDECHKRGLESL
jgi:hypothetical protein